MYESAGPSDAHANAVNQFKEICGVDETVARFFLQESAWNLENAIQEYYLKDESEAANRTEPSSSQTTQPLRAQQDNGQPSTSGAVHRSLRANNVSTPAPSTIAIQTSTTGSISGWFQWLHHCLITVPLDYIYVSVTNVITFLYTLLASPSLPITNPREDVRQFLDLVAAITGNNHSPFIESTYNEVVRRTRRDICCALIYLHSNSAEGEQFLRSHLLSDDFLRLMQRNNCLMWGVCSTSPEGRRVANSLKIMTFPAFAILSTSPNGQVGCFKQLSGLPALTQPNVHGVLQEYFNQNQVHLEVLRQQRAAMENNRRLMQEQEREYQLSLQADRARIQKKAQDAAEKKAREIAEREEIDRRELYHQRFLSIRDRILSQLPPPATPINDGKCDGIVRLRLKFPTGPYHVWSFDSAASLEELFNVVVTRDNCPQNFTLLTGHPAKALNCAPEWYREFTDAENVSPANEIPTFAEAGLLGTAVIFVRDNDA